MKGLVCIFAYAKIVVSLGLALATKAPPALWILIFEFLRHNKKRNRCICIGSFFMGWMKGLEPSIFRATI